MDLYDSDIYASQMEEQLSYHALKNEYSGTEILKEALLFMNSAFSGWTSNSGVGAWAAEFIYTNLENLKDLQENPKYTSSDILIAMNLEFSKDYKAQKASYAFFLGDVISKAFDIANEDFEVETEHLSLENYIAYYKMELEKFKEEYLEIVTYNFEDDIII